VYCGCSLWCFSGVGLCSTERVCVLRRTEVGALLTSVRIALPECPVAGTSLTSRLLAEVTRTWRSPALVYFTHYLKELL
jgi:hypothetical protein